MLRRSRTKLASRIRHLLDRQSRYTDHGAASLTAPAAQLHPLHRQLLPSLQQESIVQRWVLSVQPPATSPAITGQHFGGVPSDFESIWEPLFRIETNSLGMNPVTPVDLEEEVIDSDHGASDGIIEQRESCELGADRLINTATTIGAEAHQSTNITDGPRFVTSRSTRSTLDDATRASRRRGITAELAEDWIAYWSSFAPDEAVSQH